jgi:hypothetical protein
MGGSVCDGASVCACVEPWGGNVEIVCWGRLQIELRSQ